MIYICNFYAHQKEGVSNQIELLRNHSKGYLFAAGIFLNQKHFLYKDICQNRIILSKSEFINTLPNFVNSLPKNESIHYFSEGSELDKLKIFNSVPNKLYISMYRRPTKKYALFLNNLKNLVKIYVELDCHKKKLIACGIESDKIIVSKTPSMFKRSIPSKNFTGKFLFASWNGGDLNSLRDRGLIAVLDLVESNPSYECNILLRDDEIFLYNEMIEGRGLSNRITLSKIDSHKDLCEAFNNTDIVLFPMQRRITKDVPNSVIDGFMLGKPVIITSVLDLSKDVAEFDMGWVVNPGKALDQVITEETYKKKCRNAFRYSEQMSDLNYIKTVVSGYIT